MAEPILSEVLEATGYLVNGEPAHGVCLGAGFDGHPRFRDFLPDARWRGESSLTVYFKYEIEGPSEEQIATWHREIWNQGCAPLLWVVSPSDIRLYNGFGRPQEEGNSAAHLLDTFERVEEDIERLDALAGRLAMETGKFWPQVQDVNRGKCVDRELLADLNALERDLLSADLDRPNAQGLIGRSIFTQYLIDRGIVTPEFLQSEYGHGTLSCILRDRQATRRLFDWLRDTFNGDMFPAEASSLPETRHLGRVADFLDAVDPVSGQSSLFPYQFDVIPVELISSIYEQFAHAESVSGDGANRNDVHYTRLALVALVLDEVTDGLDGRETVLDPSCGSGVFLVESLRRLVARRCNGGSPTRPMIRAVLHDQIHGVDISEAAVRVAALSLYLAALELDPDPKPPAALEFKPLIGRTLIIADALSVENAPEGGRLLTEAGERRKFDVIVGNPPWSYQGRAARAATEPRPYQGSTRSPRGVSLDFLLTALDFASRESRLGMVLSGVQFFSRSRTGMSTLRDVLTTLSPVTLVDLSYQSNWLFPRSSLPAMVLLARHRPSVGDTITAVQVPWSPAGERSHTFEIGREDIVTLSTSDWLSRPEFLKTAFFGLGRDLGLLERLTDRHESLGKRMQALGTRFRSGLSLGDGSRDSRFLHGLPVVTKSDVQPFVVSSSLSLFQSDRAERPRSRGTYRAPLLLVREFLQAGGRTVCAVIEQDVVFTGAVRGAAFPRDKVPTAYLVAAILSSSLASWFFLMTASTFGLSMRRLLLGDIERLPVPDLESLSGSIAGQRLIELCQRRETGQFTAEDWYVLDETVFDLYELDSGDRIVARDGLVRAGWQWQSGRIASAKSAETHTDVLAYAETFLVAVNAWLVHGRCRRMSSQVFDLPPSAPHRVVRFVLEGGTPASTVRVIEPAGSLRDLLDQIGRRLHVRFGESLIGQRALRVYGPNEVVIIKPAARRHWMGVSALDDADAVVADSIAGLVG